MLRKACIRLAGRRFWVETVTYWTELYHANLTPRTRGLAALLTHAVRPGDQVLDVGANIGRITHALARAVGPHGLVHAFEPTPCARRVLEGVVRLRRLRQVRVVAAAAGSLSGELELVLPLMDGWKPMHQITHAARIQPSGALLDGQRITVPCLRLDDHWESAGRPDLSFVKCDTEGHEPEVFQGARGLLETCRPAVFCEVEAPYLARAGRRPEELFQHFHDIGYRPFLFDEPHRPRPVAGYERRSNYLFLHPARWPRRWLGPPT